MVIIRYFTCSRNFLTFKKFYLVSKFFFPAYEAFLTLRKCSSACETFFCYKTPSRYETLLPCF